MSFLIDNWFWLSAAVISGLGLLLPALRGGPASALSVAEAVQLINREKAVVIDVSSAEEYAAGHIAGARNLPLDQLATAKALPANKELPLVLVCASGTRARRAVGTLTGLGHKRVHVLGGGLSAWREANLPVEKAA